MTVIDVNTEGTAAGADTLGEVGVGFETVRQRLAAQTWRIDAVGSTADAQHFYDAWGTWCDRALDRIEESRDDAVRLGGELGITAQAFGRADDEAAPGFDQAGAVAADSQAASDAILTL